MKTYGLREAKKRLNELTKCGLYGRIMIDRNTGKIWCNEYVDCNSYTLYDDEAITQLSFDYETNCRTYSELAEHLMREYRKRK